MPLRHLTTGFWRSRLRPETIRNDQQRVRLTSKACTDKVPLDFVYLRMTYRNRSAKELYGDDPIKKF